MASAAGNCAIRRRAVEPTAGFTLVELMIVMGIAAILLALAGPSFRELTQNTRMTTVTNDLFSSINLTRSEAIKRGARVNMTPTVAGSKWEDGWTVFVDKNENLAPDAGDEIILEHGPAGPGITVAANFTGAADHYLSYNGTGRTRSDESPLAPVMGSFSLAADGQVKRKIIINLMGRARTCNIAQSNSKC